MEPDSHPQRRAPWGHAPNPMTDDPSMRAMHINQLKDRIERSAYTVDADAVADRRARARGEVLHRADGLEHRVGAEARRQPEGHVRLARVRAHRAEVRE